MCISGHPVMNKPSAGYGAFGSQESGTPQRLLVEEGGGKERVRDRMGIWLREFLCLTQYISPRRTWCGLKVNDIRLQRAFSLVPFKNMFTL
jgi:hypothetical protein